MSVRRGLIAAALCLSACSPPPTVTDAGIGGEGGGAGGGGGAAGAGGGTATGGGLGGGLEPRLPGDVCQTAGAPITMTTVLPGQSTRGLFDDYRDAGGGCAFPSTPGADRVHEVIIPPGQRLTATAAPDAGYDLAIDLVLGPASNCDSSPRTCLSGSDVNISGQQETAQHLNTGATPQSVFVIIDSFKAGDAGMGTYDLFLTLAPPPRGDTCATAVPLDGGAAGQTFALYGNDYSGVGTRCAALSGGSDRVYAITVPPMQRVTVVVAASGVNASLSLAASAAECDARVCLSEGTVLSTTDLAQWVNRAAVPQTVLAIVDAEALAPAGSFSISTLYDPAPTVPANDTCAGALAIGPGASPAVDLSAATSTGDPAPTCQADISSGVWFSFTPPSSGSWLFSTCSATATGTTLVDTVLAVFEAPSGCTGPFTQVIAGCNDEYCASQSSLAVSLAAGTTYYVVAYRFGQGVSAPGQSSVQLHVAPVVPPSNDVCAAAAPIALDRPAEGTTVGAANDHQIDGGCLSVGPVPPTGALGRDVVFVFTPDAGGRYSFRARASSENVALYLSSDCDPGPTVSTCRTGVDRNTAAAEEIACVGLDAGAPVFAYVDARTLLLGSGFELEVSACTAEAEPNSTPATASPLACPVTGGIAPAGDVDFFALGAPPAGSRLFALADGIAGISTDFDMRVTTATDTLEFDSSANDVAFGGLAPSVAGTPLTGAAAFLRINIPSTNSVSDPYRLYAVVQAPSSSATPEVEPNDAVASAGAPGSGWLSGSVTPADADVFAFDAVAGDLVHAGLDGDPSRDGTPLNARLELLDSAGAVVLAVDDTGATSVAPSDAGSALTLGSPSAPSESFVWRARSSGRYHVRVTTVSGAGDYLLSITKNCVAGP